MAPFGREEKRWLGWESLGWAASRSAGQVEPNGWGISSGGNGP